jgi:hypothetical protein
VRRGGVPSFQPLQCHPGQRRGAGSSCFSKEDLGTLRDAWNRLHPSSPLSPSSESPEEVWSSLKTRLASVCSTESCWAHRLAPDASLRAKLLDAFAPEAPASWAHNPNEWLSNLDIEEVMQQFEEKYPCFQFMGASSIDFDAPLHPDRPELGAVDPPIATFSLAKHIRQGRHKIAFVFNLDRHDQPGSHWVSLFVHWKHRLIFYFDSAGDSIPPPIQALVTRLQRQANALRHPLRFQQNHPNAHQEGDTECGVYALFFIVHMLEDRLDSTFWTTRRIPDEDVQRYRHTYFNPHGTVGE